MKPLIVKVPVALWVKSATKANAVARKAVRNRASNVEPGMTVAVVPWIAALVLLDRSAIKVPVSANI